MRALQGVKGLYTFYYVMFLYLLIFFVVDFVTDFPVKLQLSEGEIRKIRISVEHPYADCLEALRKLGITAKSLRYIDIDGDEVTVSSDQEIISAKEEITSLKFVVTTYDTCDGSDKAEEKDIDLEEPPTKLPKLKLGDSLLRSFQKTAIKVTNQHKEMFGVKCVFSARRKLGVIVIRCGICSVDLHPGSISKDLQSAKVHMDTTSHRSKLYRKKARNNLDSEKITDLELRIVQNKSFVREIADGVFTMHKTFIQCKFCKTSINWLPKCGSFKANVTSHLSSKKHTEKKAAGVQRSISSWVKTPQNPSTTVVKDQ